MFLRFVNIFRVKDPHIDSMTHFFPMSRERYMWSYTAGGASVAALGYAYHHYHRHHCWHGPDRLIDCIEGIRTIEDVVHTLGCVARHQSTEAMAEAIHEAIAAHGIRESTLCRLSELHRRYGSDDGCYGYAINMLWSLMLDAVSSGAVIYVDE